MKKLCIYMHKLQAEKLQSVQKLKAVKMFLLAISETTVGLSLSMYRWEALHEQDINM